MKGELYSMYNLVFNGDTTVYLVDFSWVITDKVVQVLNPDLPPILTGFKLSRVGFEDNWDYTDYKTVYRTIDGGLQFSNDGSIWIEPLKDVTVGINWFDNEDEKGLRPDSITATVVLDDEEIGTFQFDATNEWKHTYKDCHMWNTYKLRDLPKLEGYNDPIQDVQFANYSIIPDPVPPQPTIEELAEEIEDTQLGLTEAFEYSIQNQIEITANQEAITELYEMIIGG